MTTLADYRSRVKAALGIVGTTGERGYDDASLDQHIRQTVEEFSLFLPAEATADLTLAAGSRTLNLAALPRVMRVAAVEAPSGQWPRVFVDFDSWDAALTLAIAPPALNLPARVYYEQVHLVDAFGSTIAPEHEHLIVEGGAAFALLARAAGAAQVLETATAQPLTYQHLRLAQERLDRWKQSLRRVSGRIVQQRLYTPGSSATNLAIVREP